MLSEPERRTLDDIATRLSVEDPTWVEGFGSAQRRLTGPTQPAWMRYMLLGGATLMSTLGLIMLVAGVPSLAVVFLLGCGGFMWFLDRASSERRVPPAPGHGAS